MGRIFFESRSRSAKAELPPLMDHEMLLAFAGVLVTLRTARAHFRREIVRRMGALPVGVERSIALFLKRHHRFGNGPS